MKIQHPAKKDVNTVKLHVAAKYSLKKVPSNSELIRGLKTLERKKLLPLLQRKVVRTISGITAIAVVTKPHNCPHGKCAYCPGGPKYNVPSAYVGLEPAIMRGIQNLFDPLRQTKSRIAQLQAIGHSVDKAEIIVMGGTFPSMPNNYQEFFIKRCLDAITNKNSTTFEEAKQNAEASEIRNVGITIETRPDWSREHHVDRMLSMGVTRVELGVQNIDDDIYELVDRGHSVQDVIDATRTLKDAGLKVAYHLMPGLPGSSIEQDLKSFQKVFRDPLFKPDMIKIYPCLVLKGTKVYEWWKQGKFNPYTTEEAAELILEVKKSVPPWMRIMRIQRDIPAHLIEAGVDQSNLRQVVLKKLEEEGVRCRCIRCREVGHRRLRDGVKPDQNSVRIQFIKEKAANGIDIFISAEDPVNEVLLGFLRLRIPSEKAHRNEIVPEITSIVRELHIYGPMVPVGNHVTEAWQHRGWGGTLLNEAERISQEEYDKRKIVVTSALGTKQYYMRFGYKRDGPYVSRVIK